MGERVHLSMRNNGMQRLAWIGKRIAESGMAYGWRQWQRFIKDATGSKLAMRGEELAASALALEHSEAASSDVARLLHDKAMLMRMVREIGLELVHANQDLSALRDQ